MKKSLLIITTALVFAACSNVDTVKKDIQTSDDDAISFESFTSKQTRAENSNANYSWAFIDHHDSFQVWGYKNTSSTPVFVGDIVTVTEPEVKDPREFIYSYSPIRFWDKAATEYEFYAAAPSGTDGSWEFISTGITAANITTPAGQNKGYFTTSSSLTPDNLSTSSNYAYTNSFKGKTDKDKLIAAPVAVPYANFKKTVQFDFIHILSRLNVTIKADADLVAPSQDKNKQEIKMVSLIIKNLKTTGNFDEHLDDPATSGSIARWKEQGTLKDYTGVANTTVTETAKYVLQSLVIPQEAPFEVVALDGAAHDATPATYYANVAEYNAAKGLTGTDAKDGDWWNNTATTADKTKTPAGTNVKAATDGTEPYLVLTYTIQQTHDASGTALTGTALKPAETFVAYFNLANAFGLTGATDKLSFYEGWQNTLNITISPVAIEFCADVAEWSTYERGLTVD